MIDGCARHGIRGISPWRDQVAQMGLQQAKKSIREKDLVVTGLCRGGFFTAKDWRDDNRRAIEEAHELGAQCLVLVVGGLPAGSKDLIGAREPGARRHCRDPAGGAPAGVPLAIEPLHPMQAAERACINTLEQALDLCDALGDGLGVAVDVYHVWWDPKLRAADRARGQEAPARVPHLRLAVADARPDQRSRHDGRRRHRPAAHPRVGRSRRLRGFQEVEIFSELDWWKRDPDEVLEICKKRSA